MRLIDADTLWMVTDGTHEYYERFEIEDAPTVDAIPITWINEWYDRHAYAEVGDLLNDWAEREE